MKKTILLLSLIFTLLISSVSTKAYNGWASEYISEAQAGGILSTAQINSDLTAPITRADIAMLAVKTYINVNGYDLSQTKSHFTDTQSVYAEAAYQLEIMGGTSDTEFTPYSYATRQEMAKIILSLDAVLDGDILILPDVPSADFTDFDAVSGWAKPYVAMATAKGLINGYPDGSFGGGIPVTWEQAVTLILRCTDLNPMPEIPTIDEAPDNEINISGYVGNVNYGKTRIKWNTPTNATTVTVTQERNSNYEGDIAPESGTYQSVGYIDIELNPNRRYTIAVDGGPSKTFGVDKVTPVGANEINASYPTTKEEADALMVSLPVPVWRLSGGNKVSSTATFSVHNAIADKVKLVFEEIYNGEEKFPIKDVGGYAWRGGRSEHNGGTAIDINYDENYCIYNNGTVIGKYWKPGEDPYSIKPYGDVVNAFERHGFTWGGDAWRNPKDYMHFSYLGT